MRACFQVVATDEQIKYASDLIEYSIKNHTVPNIWDIDKKKKKKRHFYALLGLLVRLFLLMHINYKDTKNLSVLLMDKIMEMIL